MITKGKMRALVGLWPIITILSLTAAGGQSLRVPSTHGEAADETTVDEFGSRQDDGGLLLTLEQAIRLALESNVAIAVERYQRSRSILGILQNQGIYDLRLDSTVATESETSPPTSTLQAADIIVDDTSVANFSLSQLAPFGGSVVLDFNNTNFETTDQNLDPNPRFRINLDLTVTQPLLQNRGRLVTESNLVVARKNAEISLEDFQTRVEDVLQQVTDGYWNLVEAREQLRVAENSLKLAEDLDRMNRLQVEVGTLAAIEVIQSEAGVAARKEGIITFSAQVGDAADALRRLVNLEVTGAWDVEIVPATAPETETRADVDVDEAIRTAFQQRPDVRRQRLQNEVLDLDAQVARNLKLPRLDLQATYGYNALDGDRFDRDDDGRVILDPMGNPIRTPGGYGGAFDQITGGDYEGWSVGVILGYPIQNRDARARSADADLAAEQGALVLHQLELFVRAEVRSAARALRAAAQRVETAKLSSRLARRSFEAEQKRYENGLSTSFEVLQFQEDLSEAESREVSAIVSYRRAETVYFRAVGQLLDQFGVILEGS